ncbi:MAG TPA: hypothetical protein VJJ47_03170 [Candidatus Paceibacterota bacterium]
MKIAIICSASAHADASRLCGSLPFFGYQPYLGVWDDGEERAPAVLGIAAAECVLLVGNPLPKVAGESLADIFVRLGKAVLHVPYSAGASAGSPPAPAAWVDGLATWPAARARRHSYRAIATTATELVHVAIGAAVAEPFLAEGH